MAAIRWRLHPGRDEGTSLIELVVGMTLMAVFGGLFTGAVVMMNSSMNKAQAVSTSSAQLNQAFLVLDKTVRYAAAISTPGLGAPSNDWYVELRATTAGVEVCTQFRVDIGTQQLQRRTWNAISPVATLTSFLPIASGISNGAATSGATSQPFYLVRPTASANVQQLTVNLSSPAGSGTALTTSFASFTFSALNSTLPVPTAPICQQQTRP